ncbi:MAG TPA: hypothetical protein VFK72_05035, partial [Nevskia sp.]|nr:hypothetical protein [Nevskia sp.]
MHLQASSGTEARGSRRFERDQQRPRFKRRSNSKNRTQVIDLAAVSRAAAAMTIAPPGPPRIMLKQTALHADHVRLGAKLVDFAGWDMPIQYASQLDEHHAVRQSAGMFDVAHMSAIDLHGIRTREFLRHLLANDVAKLKPTGKAPADAGIGIGKALYSCMLNPQAGVIDDLIVYLVAEDAFRLV